MHAYSYDASGNLRTGGGRSYVWTSDQQPKSITHNGVTETYTYDADGERLSRTRNGVTTWYLGGLWDEGVVPDALGTPTVPSY